MSESKRLKVATVESANGVITWSFSNGETRACNPADLTEAIRNQAMEHGFTQKLSDCYAGVGSFEDPVATAVSMWDKTYETLVAGNWKARVAKEAAEPPVERLAKAFHAAMATVDPSKTLEQIRAFVEGLDKKGRAMIRAIPEVGFELQKQTSKAPSLAEVVAKLGG